MILCSFPTSSTRTQCYEFEFDVKKQTRLDSQNKIRLLTGWHAYHWIAESGKCALRTCVLAYSLMLLILQAAVSSNPLAAVERAAAAKRGSVRIINMPSQPDGAGN